MRTTRPTVCAMPSPLSCPSAGVTLEVLKELMGHRSLNMTLRYTRLYERTKRSQYDRAMEQIEQRQGALRGAGR